MRNTQSGKFVAVTLLSVCILLGIAAAGEPDGPVTPERAREIALAQVGGGEVMELDRHRRGDRAYYRLEIAGNDGAFHIEIDADTGRLLQFIRKHGFDGYRSGTAPIVPPTAGGPVTSYEQALATAMEMTGGGTVVESEVDVKRSGRVIYEFEIVNNGQKFEIEIDSFGNILEFKQKGRRYHLPPRSAAPAPSAPPPARLAPSSPAPQPLAPGQKPKLGIASVQALAIEQAGGGMVTDYSLSARDGGVIHRVMVARDDLRYDMEIDDENGVVLKMSTRKAN